MKLKLKLLFGALLHKKLRLLLSLIGIIIGVSALLIMNSFGESAKVKTLAEIETFGPDLFMVISGSARVMAGRAMQTEQMTTLKVEDAQALRNLPGVKNISPVYTGQTVVRGEGVNLITTVNGVNEEYVTMRNYPLLEGRNFSREEIQTLSKVVILGYKIKNQVFGEKSAVGEKVLVSKLPFTVIGVLAPIGVDASGQDQDDQVLVPYTTAMSALFNVDYLTGIFIKAEATSTLPYLVKQVEELLIKRHKVDPKRKDFSILKAEDLVQAKEQTTRTFSSLVASVSILCLIVGALGVAGIMTLAVNERTKEIGLRLALGAQRRDIFMQFLIESLFITLAGGLIGIILGLILVFILLPVFNYPLIVPVKPVLVSSFLTIIIGLFAGVYPAYRATKIDPAILLKSG
jgi:ABC-type antimicrobial peptide transport system permease subunit